MNKFYSNGSLLWLISVALLAGLPLFAQTPAPLHVFNVENPRELQEFFQYTPQKIPFVSAHRGGARPGYPENCLATFKNTLQHTWSILEIDPHYTQDSLIILMHDATLDRTTNGRGKVADYPLAELQKLKLKDPAGLVTDYSIPTLDEALEWAKGKTILILDMKDVPVEARVRKIQEHDAQAWAMVMAYTFEDAKRCYAMDKNIMMEVFIPDREAAVRFEKSGIPWKNIVAFVTHTQPKDSAVLQYLHEKGVMAIIGSSRTIDQAFTEGDIGKKQLQQGYHEILTMGADIIEADLSLEAGAALPGLLNIASPKKRFFTTKP